MNSEPCGRKWTWPHLSYYLTLSGGLRKAKTHDSWSVVQTLKWGLGDCERKRNVIDLVAVFSDCIKSRRRACIEVEGENIWRLFMHYFTI